MANKITIAREHKVFAVLESTAGSLTFPSDSDLVIPAGYGVLNQNPTYTDSEEVIDSRSLINRFQDRLPAGDWELPIYIRPDGTLGNKPQGANIFKALFGAETADATGVFYTLAKELPSLSIWAKIGPQVFFCQGTTVNQMRFSVSVKGAPVLTFSGNFMYMGWVGTDTLSAAVDGTVTPVTAIPVTDAKKFRVGGRIVIGDDDNAGAGFEITAVDVATNTLTISPGIATTQAAGATVAPFLPTGTVVGSPVESRDITVSVGGVTTKIKSADLTITNNVQYLEDEIGPEAYPTAYVEDRRSVSGSLSLYFRQDDLKLFYDGYQGNEVALEIDCGQDAGKQARFIMDRVNLSVPRINPTAPTVELNMDFVALGTNGEDEIKLNFD